MTDVRWVTYHLGPWSRDDEPSPGAPHGRIGVIYATDEDYRAKVDPMAVADGDGCRAVVLRMASDEVNDAIRSLHSLVSPPPDPQKDTP